MRLFKNTRSIFSTVGVCAVVFALSACSTIYPLGGVARRASDPKSLEQDITFDGSRRELGKVKSVAWVAYSVTFDCPNDCSYTAEERDNLSREIAETSFAAFDRELRKAVEDGRTVMDVETTVKSPAFALEIKNDSFKARMSRWIERLGLSRRKESTATARALKFSDPSEIGWSGAKSLAEMGKQLGVDGVLVAHIRVSSDPTTENPRRLLVTGPRIWLFSSSTAQAVAIATLKPRWRLEPNGSVEPELQASSKSSRPVARTEAVTKLDASKELRATRFDWSGIDDVASGFSSRIARALNK